MKSTLFFTVAYKDAVKIKGFLNKQKEFLSGSTVKSTRAAGDAIQDILATHFQSILGEQACDLVRQASLGLQRAYEKGIVQRYIKPNYLECLYFVECEAK